MKIGLFIYVNSYMLGGAERRMSRLFSELSKYNYEVHILLLNKTNTLKALIDEISSFTNGNVQILGFKKLYDVLKYISKAKFKWVTSISPTYTNYIVFLVSKLFGSKRLFASVSYNTSSLIAPKKELKRFSLMIKNSNVIDCLYPSYTPILRSKFPKKRIITTPGSFTDINKYSPIKKENIIVFAGRMNINKSPQLMVEAIIDMEKDLRKNQFKCIIAGNGPLYSTIIRKVNEAKISDIVYVYEYVDTSEILCQAKIFCSLQNVTNYPSQSLIEAMACGCFIIASNVGDTYRIVNNDFGSLIDLDKKCLKNAILNAIKFNDSKWEEISIKSREFIILNHNISNSLNYYDNIFKDRGLSNE